MPHRTALWLLPDAAQAAYLLDHVLGRVARRLGREPFTPHVTLCGGLELSARRLAAGLDGLAAETSPLELAVDRAEATASTFRALVLLLRPTRELLLLRRRLVALLPSPPRLPTPHLSLTYGALPLPMGEVLAGVALPDLVRFDAIALAAPGAGGWEDTSGWSLLHRVTLGGGSTAPVMRPTA